MAGKWAILAGVALATLATAAHAETSSAVRRHADRIAGLQAPASILVDQWGVPHIRAASEHDAFFLQGWNAARDRLWQIDLWRKRGLGLLSASFGPAYADQDRAARLFLYRGDMAAEWAAYGAKAQSRAEAFVAGVNAYVAQVRAGRQPLPVEFTLTHSQPDDWKAEDVVRIRSHALSRNADSEVARARVACAAGPGPQGLAADRLRRKLEPAWTTKVPAGLDPCVVPADVLKDYELATRDVSFAALGKTAAADPPTDTALAAMTDKASAEGSNNWVIGPGRTATGRPLLANDPHRSLGVPSLRYIVHLKAPGLDVIGAGEPALPGVSVGHNEAIAFGLTIFAIDQEDLYVYDLNPANPRQYRYAGRWEDMQVAHETIPVKDGPPREVELLFTRHGPVVRLDAAGHHAFAVRTVWGEPGTSAYFGSIDYMDAQDWAGFQHSMARWGAPSENLVFASTAGDIGWIAAGRAPVRPNWDGLMPVPGDGRYEWKGSLDAGQLPSEHDPARGWFASANEMNLPDGYPIAERKVGFEWSDPTRIHRIKQVLAANVHVSVADAMALQMDPTSAEAGRLVALLKPLTASDPDAAAGLALLQGWDGAEPVNSAAAALYELWAVKVLGPATVAVATPPAARALVGAGSLDAVITLLEAPDSSLGPDPKAARDRILLSSLAEAVRQTRGLLGPDPARWSWGALHKATFRPAVAALADPSLAAQMSVGPLQVRGSASTPAAATWRPSDFAAVAGASYRMVVDVGNWDASVAVNTPGQSGDPFNPHYRDLFPLWAGGDYFPLAFSDAAVDAAARDEFDLTPGG
ncbi:penicillin acylase family protein [Caulobacter sp. KR2-114]|uniref:penicillin acylase family protein n=1 Tax=Caulobacter sp. KR2-114 TaxID=3400912 RepID=UPI003C0E6F43